MSVAKSTFGNNAVLNPATVSGGPRVAANGLTVAQSAALPSLLATSKLDYFPIVCVFPGWGQFPRVGRSQMPRGASSRQIARH